MRVRFRVWVRGLVRARLVLMYYSNTIVVRSIYSWKNVSSRDRSCGNGGAVAVSLVSQAYGANSIPARALALYVFSLLFLQKFSKFSAGSIALEKVVRLPDQ